MECNSDATIVFNLVDNWYLGVYAVGRKAIFELFIELPKVPSYELCLTLYVYLSSTTRIISSTEKKSITTKSLLNGQPVANNTKAVAQRLGITIICLAHKVNPL